MFYFALVGAMHFGGGGQGSVLGADDILGESCVRSAPSGRNSGQSQVGYTINLPVRMAHHIWLTSQPRMLVFLSVMVRRGFFSKNMPLFSFAGYSIFHDIHASMPIVVEAVSLNDP